MRRLEQAGPPLTEKRGDLILIFFGDELIGARLRVEEERVERRLGAIMGVEVKFSGLWGWIGKGDGTEGCWKKRGGSSLG